MGRGDSTTNTLQSVIDVHGWAVIGVFPTRDDDGIPFSYTVGLTDKGLPELAIYGLGPGNSARILNAAGRRMVRRGELRGGDRVGGVLAFDAQLAVIDMADTADLSAVRHLYGVVLAARQIVWPDAQGRMPWEGWNFPDAAQPLKN